MMPPGQALPASEQERVLAIKIARAMASGPREITKDATVAEMGPEGKLVILRKGTNEWACFPGNENEIGNVPMCADPMGLQWMMDIHARKPKPTNTAPGLIYMLCGATQHSTTDPFDRTSPGIPVGPHWMIIWPFDAKRCGLPNTVRDAGHVGDVRRHALRASARLRHTVGRKRIRARPGSDLDDEIWQANRDLTRESLWKESRIGAQGSAK
jgi:hypothetical protein